jgi:tRNA(Ile)-lysidine synthase
VNDWVERVEKSIFARNLFRDAQPLLIAVSGGLDSMVLLHLLTRLAHAHRWQIAVAHFNHQLRGRASDTDELLVKRTAEQMRLPCVSGGADVRNYSRQKKISLEMAARKLRHEFLVVAATRLKTRTIALAHHADDQAELFFVRLLRGAGTDGLAGMKWLSPSPADSKIILARPLLDETKASLEIYAKQESVEFREDATNACLDIQRNRIRSELLPLLAKHYQRGFNRVLLRQMEILGAEADFVNAAAVSWLGGKNHEDFDTLALAVQRRCLHLQLIEHGVTPNFDLIEQLRESPEQPITINTNQIAIRRPNGRVILQSLEKSAFDESSVELRLKGGAGELFFEGNQISWGIVSNDTGTCHAVKKGEKPVNVEYFDADKTGKHIRLRHWQPGDRFQPIGMVKPVKLQDLFINEKISRSRRHSLAVATTADGELFWVEGLRIGDRFKLDKTTRYQLKWSWKRVL